MPILVNAIPVSLGNDAYPIAIGASFLLHHYFPILREIVKLSPALKVGADFGLISLYKYMELFLVTVTLIPFRNMSTTNRNY